MYSSERLKRAYNFIKDREEYIGKVRKEFVSLSKRLPSLLLSNGMMLTVLYLEKRKGEEGSEKAESLILDYLRESLSSAGLLNEYEGSLLDYLFERSPEEVSLMLDESLLAAEALKLLVEAKYGEVKGA